jgi:hypothetical protein
MKKEIHLKKLIMRATIIISALLVTSLTVNAQDTLKRKEVNITSTFKPSLKEAAKININATPPTPDTTTPRLQYNIPNQNLSFKFQPGSLKPLALDVDTGGRFDLESYVKLGYGNLNTPFAQAGFSFGDGRTRGLNVYAKHFSSKGKIQFQDVSHTNIDLNGFFQTGNNLEWTARLGGQQEQYKKFGFEPKTLEFPKDSINVKYQTWSGRIAMHNINRTELGISYAPEIKVDAINDGLKNSESNSYISLPLSKTLGTSFQADLGLEANFSKYDPQGKSVVNNRFFIFSPAVRYASQNLSIQAGVRPSWDNSNFKLLPNVMAEITTADKKFAIQAGWTGNIRYSGLQYVAGMNPWIWAPDRTFNTTIEERYGGIKGSIGDHVSYGAKFSYNTHRNQPLFMNDTITGKSFMVVNEPEMNVMNLGGELGYTVGEKFSMITTVAFNRFSTEFNNKAWGMIPVEFNTALRLQVLKDLYVNGNIYAFDGPWAYDKKGSKDMQGGLDLSGGLEFKVVPRIKLWLQFNNILGKEYQRWNQYPSYGLNFLGGVVFSFAQNK